MFQYGDVEVSEARGFSLDHETAPLIALNVTDSPRARAFTIIHELTHILIGANGICTPHEADYNGKSRAIEQFCDGVAASTLIPSSSFVAQAEVANHDEGAAWSDATIARLSHRYGVSRLVIVMRLNGLRLMSDGELGAKVKLYNQPWKPKGGMVPQPTKILANMGRSFTRLVLDSYNASVITAPELARVLGIKINNLAALVSALEEGGG